MGIGFDSKDTNNISDLNIKTKINDMTEIIRTQGARSLTLYGKVTAIKSLVMSKITHLLLALPCPSDELLNKYKSFAYCFWQGKTPRFSKIISEAEISQKKLYLDQKPDLTNLPKS